MTVIDPSGTETTQYPCFEHQTLTDLLNAKGISWRYYANSAGSIWTAPNAIQHMCQPNVAPPNGSYRAWPNRKYVPAIWIVS